MMGNGAHSHDELEQRIEAVEARLAAMEHAAADDTDDMKEPPHGSDHE